MRLKFFFIFFSLIFGILTLSLKKKIQKNKYPYDESDFKIMQKDVCKNPNNIGQRCGQNEQCTSYKCEKGYCVKNTIRGSGARCFCDFHCSIGTCTFTPFGPRCSKRPWMLN